MRDIGVSHVGIREGRAAFGWCLRLSPVLVEVTGVSVCVDWRVRLELYAVWRLLVFVWG